MQLTLHIPSHIILQRFCKVAQATSSSHMQWIFIPSLHFSIFMVQRGTATLPMGIDIGMVEDDIMGIDVPIPVMPFPIIIGRSIIMTAIAKSSCDLTPHPPNWRITESAWPLRQQSAGAERTVETSR
jgi:hypothetical protein